LKGSNLSAVDKWHDFGFLKITRPVLNVFRTLFWLLFPLFSQIQQFHLSDWLNRLPEAALMSRIFLNQIFPESQYSPGAVFMLASTLYFCRLIMLLVCLLKTQRNLLKVIRMDKINTRPAYYFFGFVSQNPLNRWADI